MLKMELEIKQGIIFIRLKGKLLRNNCYKINNYLNTVVEKHKIKYVVYNFTFLEDIDSPGIDAILNTKYIVKNNKGKIRMCGINNNIKNKIKKIGLARIADEIAAFKLLEVHNG